MSRSEAVWNYFSVTGFIGAYLMFKEIQRQEAGSKSKRWFEEREG